MNIILFLISNTFEMIKHGFEKLYFIIFYQVNCIITYYNDERGMESQQSLVATHFNTAEVRRSFYL